MAEMRRDMMAYFRRARRDVRPHIAGLRGGARHAARFLRAVISRTRRTPICAFCTTRRRTPAKTNLFGQAPHTDNSFMTALARTDVPGLAVRLPSGEWFAAADHPRHVPDQSRQHHAALVERPVSVDAARRAQRQRHRPLFDRLFPQPEPGQRHRVPAELRLARQPAALPAGRLSRPRARILPRQLFPPEGAIAPTPRCRSGRNRRKRRSKTMFDLDRFIEDCRAAVRADPSHKAAREVVARAVSDPAAILAGARRADAGRGRRRSTGRQS